MRVTNPWGTRTSRVATRLVSSGVASPGTRWRSSMSHVSTRGRRDARQRYRFRRVPVAAWLSCQAAPCGARPGGSVQPRTSGRASLTPRVFDRSTPQALSSRRGSLAAGDRPVLAPAARTGGAAGLAHPRARGGAESAAPPSKAEVREKRNFAGSFNAVARTICSRASLTQALSAPPRLHAALSVPGTAGCA